MTHGFFHPDVGYWETTEYPSEKYRREYPEGTVEISTKPGVNHEWSGSQWIEVPPPQFDPLTHRIEKIMDRNGETFSYRWDLIELPLETASENVRRKRDRLLASSDWVVPSCIERGQPVPQVWVEYRQALRDVPTQTGFPWNVVWPAEPKK